MQSQESSHPSAADEGRLLRRVTAASVAVAALLIIAKALAFLATGSVSLLASLVDSLIDSAASLINLLAVRYALTPADHEHRFGHGKAESLAGLMQALFIVASSAYLIHEAVHRLFDPEPVRAYGLGIAVMLFSLVATTALVTFQRHVIRRTHSAAIKADSLHYQADILGNLAVLLALFLTQWGWRSADPILALAIAAYLLFSTREIITQAMNELLDRELPEQQRLRILRIAGDHPAVQGVHDLRTRRAGRTVIIQLHIELDDQMPLVRSHRIADEVEAAIRSEIRGADVVIHQDPVGVVEQRLDERVLPPEDSDRSPPQAAD
jgi:ferrous-iron efflux pump FieF